VRSPSARLKRGWLETDWWAKSYVHIRLPREFRPGSAGGPRDFESICLMGPKSITLLKQVREAKVKTGKVPLPTDRVLDMTYAAETPKQSDKDDTRLSSLY
jgi:hypothetical protein